MRAARGGKAIHRLWKEPRRDLAGAAWKGPRLYTLPAVSALTTTITLFSLPMQQQWIQQSYRYPCCVALWAYPEPNKTHSRPKYTGCCRHVTSRDLLGRSCPRVVAGCGVPMWGPGEAFRCMCTTISRSFCPPPLKKNPCLVILGRLTSIVRSAPVVFLSDKFFGHLETTWTEVMYHFHC